jgi:hypothetical protein
MSLSSGSRLGPYEIGASIAGKGPSASVLNSAGPTFVVVVNWLQELKAAVGK